MEFIDTHTHLTDEAFEGLGDEAVDRAIAAGVTKMILPDIDSKERDAMFNLSRRHPGVLFPMLGLYPGSVDKNWREEIDKILLIRNREASKRDDEPKVIAIGEIGLDYHFSTEFKEEQKEAFRTQLELAAKWNLPVNIHLRDATEDFFDIMEGVRHLGLRGNLHAFSGSAETFQRVGRYGDWYVGIGGVLTFKKASLAETVKKIPLERIVLETDSPYLAPTPLRGTRNESANIPIIAAKLAELKGTSIEKVAETTSENARWLFNV